MSLRDDESLDACMRQEKHLSVLRWTVEKGEEALMQRIFESDLMTPEAVMIVKV